MKIQLTALVPCHVAMEAGKWGVGNSSSSSSSSRAFALERTRM